MRDTAKKNHRDLIQVRINLMEVESDLIQVGSNLIQVLANLSEAGSHLIDEKFLFDAIAWILVEHFSNLRLVNYIYLCAESQSIV